MRLLSNMYMYIDIIVMASITEAYGVFKHMIQIVTNVYANKTDH